MSFYFDGPRYYSRMVQNIDVVSKELQKEEGIMSVGSEARQKRMRFGRRTDVESCKENNYIG